VETGAIRKIGEVDRYGAPPNSAALGWRSDGFALVDLPKDPACGSGTHGGVYAVALDGSLGERVLSHPADASVRMWG
jgi:hypothetical protein